MVKKILMFLSAAVFAAGLAGCEKADMDKSKETMDKAGEMMEQPKDAMGGGAPAPAEPTAPAEPAAPAPATP
ncbi:MAG: hypothetical protein HY028_04990 [Gammaproteobacteria bacterium]|nr:hypothetical protein [Gammaproteobacteria bacterium]